MLKFLRFRRRETVVSQTPNDFMGFRLGDIVHARDVRDRIVTGMEWHKTFGPSLWISDYGIVPVREVSFVARFPQAAA